MELNSFPRPSDDTGIGIQWSLGYPAMIGMRRLEQRWIPLLQALGVKWVKFRHDGGVEFARLLSDNDIMPVVHLWPRQAGSTGFSAAELGAIRRYVDAGVRYFEYTIDEQHCIGCGKRVKGCAEMNGSLFLQVRHHLCANCNECAIAIACPSEAFRRVPRSEPNILKKVAREAEASLWPEKPGKGTHQG